MGHQVLSPGIRGGLFNIELPMRVRSPYFCPHRVSFFFFFFLFFFFINIFNYKLGKKRTTQGKKKGNKIKKKRKQKI